jgi:hypothetical protein
MIDPAQVWFYFPVVDFDNLTPAQVKQLVHAARHQGHYFLKLSGRMHQRHFRHDHPVKLAVDRVAVEIEKLNRELDRYAAEMAQKS